MPVKKQATISKAKHTELLQAERRKAREARVTKSSIEKLLVAERASMRARQKQSVFMQRTLNIYKAQVARAQKENRLAPDYNIDAFRARVEQALEVGECSYTGEKLTVKSFTADHRMPIARGGEFTLDNLAFCTKSANYQKGILSDGEFMQLNEFLNTLSPIAAQDIRKRLTVGGKFIPGK